MNAICRMSPLSLSSSMLGAEVDMKSCITNLQLQAGLLAAAAAVRALAAPDRPDGKMRTSEKIDFKKKSGGIGLVEAKLWSNEWYIYIYGNLQLQAGLLAAAAAVRALAAPDRPDGKKRTSEKIDFLKKSGGIGLVEAKLWSNDW